MRTNKLWSVLGLLILSGCTAQSSQSLEGKIRIDGSSTVFPISEAISEEFAKKYPRIQVTVGVSGTGGGFKKFINNEIDIVNASRPIKPEEIEKAKAAGVQYMEIPVALDGITLVVNKKNTWAKDITVAEIKKLWEPNSQVKTWKQLRSTWPDAPIKLYGPGADSGTFDFFTEAIMGKAGVSRGDYIKSEDDNVIVHGVTGDVNALGYFGYSYYKANEGKLNALQVVEGKGPGVAPDETTIYEGTYRPLSRTLYVYVNQKSFPQAAVNTFVQFLLNNAGQLVKDVGYIPLKPEDYKKKLSWVVEQTTLSRG